MAETIVAAVLSGSAYNMYSNLYNKYNCSEVHGLVNVGPKTFFRSLLKCFRCP